MSNICWKLHPCGRGDSNHDRVCQRGKGSPPAEFSWLWASLHQTWDVRMRNASVWSDQFNHTDLLINMPHCPWRREVCIIYIGSIKVVDNPMAYATCSKENGCQTRFEFSPTLSFELYHDVPKRLTWHNNWPNLWIPVECFTNLTHHGQEKREPHILPRIFLDAFATKAQALDSRKACWASFGIESNWVIRKGLYGCFLKWWYPQKHLKMIIFSRKTHGCWGNPPF